MDALENDIKELTEEFENTKAMGKLLDMIAQAKSIMAQLPDRSGKDWD